MPFKISLFLASYSLFMLQFGNFFRVIEDNLPEEVYKWIYAFFSDFIQIISDLVVGHPVYQILFSLSLAHLGSKLL